MSKPIIIIDVPNVSYRNWHAMGNYSGWKYPVTYGLLRDLRLFSAALGSDNFVFCFDHPKLARKEMYSEYKEGRKTDPDVREKVQKELKLLRERVLPDLGYKNILHHEGAEADDMIAFVVKERNYWQKMVIASNDTDLYQLLDGSYVSIWNPLIKTTITEGSMWKRHNLKPKEWALFKSMTGCKTDNVEGIPGVGEVTATKYIRGEIGEKKAAEILRQNKTVERNLELVVLPCPQIKVPIFQLKFDSIPDSKWNKVVTELELPTLIARSPIS